MENAGDQCSAYEQAHALYKQFPEVGNLEADLLLYSKLGYVYVDPTCLIFAQYQNDIRCWYIHIAVGKEALSRFFNLAPFESDWISFARPGKGRRNIKQYNYERMKQICTRSMKTSQV